MIQRKAIVNPIVATTITKAAGHAITGIDRR